MPMPSTRYSTPLTAETAEWAWVHLSNGGKPKDLGWRFGFDYFRQYRLVEAWKKTGLDKAAFMRVLRLP